ncbi:dUTP pyrophosphatase [Paucidesulfovibrio gracilis DSM 16080]|uniref:dUTP diphosphatase n=1 Tax=Paucidesulfovibrio gracilis DSM 16080 TaxID=1121449 RepID=A0A1T4WN29_9BACT|nr:dUTP diphosphatase [Paucidesulfovibrio gracilis]SKA78619.1 dUTP pyrophosphatase [Paucidesulfovibrio gracilis DSM 16080]
MTQDFTTPIDVKIHFTHPVWQKQELAYGTIHSAGLDLRACFDESEKHLAPGERLAISTGIRMEISEPGWAGFIFSRSGLGTKQGLTVSQGVGVIDPDYRGEIIVSLLNTSGERRVVARGQRIAQLVLLPVRQARILPVDELSDTDRGAGGFGHTGTF